MLGVGMLMAYLVEWRVVGLVAVALVTTFVLLEAHYERIDGDHAGSFVLFALAFAAAAALGSYLGEAFSTWNRGPAAPPAADEGEIAPIAPEPPPLPEAPVEAAVATALAEEGRLSLLYGRADDAEALSQVYGPRATRALLERIGEVLARQLRPNDRLLRQGAFDFCVILPRTPLEVARIRAERMRLATADERVAVGEQEVPASISIGIAASPADGSDWRNLLAAAERALEGAVSLGGNRTVLHSLPPGAPRGWGLPGEGRSAQRRASI